MPFDASDLSLAGELAIVKLGNHNQKNREAEMVVYRHYSFPLRSSFSKEPRCT
jgi:hypothetical protein